MGILTAPVAVEGGQSWKASGGHSLNTYTPYGISHAPHVLTESAVMGMYSKAPPTPAGGTPPPQPPPPVTLYQGPSGANPPGPKAAHGPAIPQGVRVGGSFYG
jgi:hypothetical protein